jgi:uncharacterized repeat protein (TIGR01451 family)
MRALLRLHPTARAVRRPHQVFRPRLEPLEERWVPFSNASGFPVTINTTGALPATAFLSGDNFAVASVLPATGTAGPTVVAQRVDSSANFIGSQIAVATSGVAPSAGAIGAAGDGNGNFLVAWPVSQTVNGVVTAGAKAQLFNVNGVPQFTQPPALLPPPQPSSESQQVSARAAMNSHGAFVLVEETKTLSATGFSFVDQFEAQEFTSAGQPIGTAPFSFTNPSVSFGTNANPVVAMDDAGDYVVVWDDAGPVVYQLFNSDSTPNSHTPNPVPLTTPGNVAAGFAVAMDPAGAFVVSWATSNASSTTGTTPGKLFAQRFDSQGNATDATPITVETNMPGGSNAPFATFTKPQVGILADGTFVVAFDDDFGISGGPTTHTIFAQPFGASGTPVGGQLTVQPPIVSTPTSPHFFLDGPSLSENAAGSFVGAWDLSTSPPLNQQGVRANLFAAASGPDVTVSKSADRAFVNAGQSAGFTVTLTNTGTAAATGVTLSDLLPTGTGNDINWQIDAGTGNPGDFAIFNSGGNQILALASGVNTLAVGQSITVHITGVTSFADAPSPSFSGTLGNTATVSAANEPPADQNQQASATVTVVAPDVTVLTAADQATVTAGQTAGFTVKVSNASEASGASGVTLNDPLPAGAGTDINWQIDPGTGNPGSFAITGPVGSQVLTLAPGVTSLSSAQTITVHITAATSFADAPLPSGSGLLTNTATVSAANEAPANQNQRSTATVNVVTPNVTVLKTADQAIVAAGDTAGFTVTVIDAGALTATGVTLNDPLPAGPGNDVNWVIDADTGNPGSFVISGPVSSQVLTLAPGVTTLAPGRVLTVHVTGATSFADAPGPSFSGLLSNTATVSAANEQPALQNQQSTATVTVVAADVTVLTVADQSPVSAGQAAGFTITVSNAGGNGATGVTLDDPLPAGAGNDVSWQIDPNTGDAGSFDLSGPVGGQELTLAPGVSTLAPGQTLTVHVTGLTTADDAPAPSLSGLLANTATASADNEAPANQDQQSTATVTVLAPDVSVAKKADQESVATGQTAGFTVTITNVGPGTATGVTLSDLLPAGAGNDINWQIDPDTGTPSDFVITGPVGDQDLTLAPGVNLPAGGALTVHVTGLTTAADAPPPARTATLQNTATVSASNEGAGLQNQQASASIDLVVPDITVTTPADQSQIDAGQSAGFTVAVSDVGTGAVTNVALDDPLPSGAAGDVGWSIDTTAGDPNDFTITGPAGAEVLSFAAPGLTLTPGQSLTVHVVSSPPSPADAPAPTFVGKLANTATVSADNEPAVQGSSTVTVLAPHLTVHKTADQDTIDAGQTAGFTVTITDDGTAPATGLVLSDTIDPGFANDINWQIDPATGDPAAFVITGPVGSQNLDLTADADTLQPGQSFTVHITGATSFDDAQFFTFGFGTGFLENTAIVSANGPISGSDTANIIIVTPNVTVSKSADRSSIEAGQQAGFTVTVSNVGAEAATGVTLGDPLPPGAGADVNWQIDPFTGDAADFVITGPVGDQSLGLAPGVTSLGAGAALRAHVTGLTSAADASSSSSGGSFVGVLPNTATVSAANEAPVLQNTKASSQVFVVRFLSGPTGSPSDTSSPPVVSSFSSSSSPSSGSSSSANAPLLVTALRPTAVGSGNGVFIPPINQGFLTGFAGPLPPLVAPPESPSGAGASATVTAALSGGGSVSRAGEISGQVFLDPKGSGVREPGGPGVAGLQVFIDVHGDGTYHPDDPYTVTNDKGEYVFHNLLVNRTYQVRPVRQQYMVQTYPLQDAAQVVPLSDDHPSQTGVNFSTVPFRPAAPRVLPVGNSGAPSTPQQSPAPADPGKSNGDQSRNDLPPGGRDEAFGEGPFWRPAALPLALAGFFALRLDRRRRTDRRRFAPPPS